jgi:hypothetical protein
MYTISNILNRHILTISLQPGPRGPRARFQTALIYINNGPILLKFGEFVNLTMSFKLSKNQFEIKYRIRMESTYSTFYHSGSDADPEVYI